MNINPSVSAYENEYKCMCVRVCKVALRSQRERAKATVSTFVVKSFTDANVMS